MFNLGDIKINGKEYRIDINSYKVKDLADFSPRASVPGGALIYSELMLYQPLNMTDWRHGFGFMWYTDAMGYMKTENDVDTRYPGIVMISTAPAARHDTSDTEKKGFVEFNGALYSWSNTALRKMNYTTGAWSTEYNGSVNFAFATENYLFYCPTNGRIRKINKSGQHSDAGINNNSINYHWLVIYRGFIYAGKANTNEVYYAENEDLSDLHGTPQDDPNMIPVGAGGYPTLGAMVYGGFLYIFRADGIWSIGEDKKARMVLDFSTELSNKNFRARTVYNGYLYFNVGSKVYQWNGARMVDMTPPRLNDEFPYEEVVSYGQMTTANNFLYVSAKYRKNPNSFIYGILSFDGVGWHKINDLQINYSTEPGALYCAPNARKLYSSWGSSPCYVAEIKLGDGFLPHPEFRTGIDHVLYTPRLDMGFRRVRKSCPSILIEGTNLSNTRRIHVDYSIDGMPFVNWGVVTSNGITELTNPGGLRTIEFNYMILRIRLYTLEATSSPILEGITVRFLLRPDVFYGYNFNIVAAENYTYGNLQDSRSPSQIYNELKVARDSKAPIEFIDIYGETHYGYISALSLMGVERHEISEDGIPNVEALINVNLVEAR